MCLAIPGRVLSIDAEPSQLPQAIVSFGGIAKKVCMAYAPEASVGDYVLVHAGFAIAALDEEAAERVFRELEAMGATEEIEE